MNAGTGSVMRNAGLMAAVLLVTSTMAWTAPTPGSGVGTQPSVVVQNELTTMVQPAVSADSLSASSGGPAIVEQPYVGRERPAQPAYSLDPKAPPSAAVSLRKSEASQAMAAPDCMVVCPPGSVLEGEPPCGEDYVDNYNGGCQSHPEVFQPIESGQVLCATSGTYLAGGANYRDTDWFEITVTGRSFLWFRLEAEFPVLGFIIAANSADCIDYTILTSDTADPCQPMALTADPVPAGTYWFWAGPNVFADYPCSLTYTAELVVGSSDPCMVYCPPGSFLEDEPACGDDYVDHYNGGCGSDPVVFQSIELEQMICGESGTYQSGGLNYRDTDWFEVAVEHPGFLYWTLEAEFPIQGAIIKPGPEGCAEIEMLAIDSTDPCVPLTVSAPLEEAGTYWLWAGVSVFTGWPCVAPYTAIAEFDPFIPCDVECPPEAMLEDEPECYDGYEDQHNGGCGVHPLPVFQPIGLGYTCGTSGTYFYDDVEIRDTDWYEVTFAAATSLVWEVTAEYPVQAFVIQANSGDCIDYQIIATASGEACEPARNELQVEAGTYWLWTGPDVFSDLACGSEYVAFVDFEEPPPCQLECPPGARLEDEPDCYEGYVDQFNSGCGGTPPVFSSIETGYTCGKGGTFLVEGINYRDTDWYQISVLDPSTLVWEVTAEYPVQAFIIDSHGGNCADLEIIATAEAEACDPARNELTVAPGIYWLWTAPAVYEGVPCGSDYVAFVEVEVQVPCEVPCPPGASSENEPLCGDDYVDETNGGCNWSPFRVTPIECWEIMCGTTGTYDYEGNNYRDTDWMEFYLDAESMVTWEVMGEFPLLTFLIDAGTGDCVDYTILDSATAPFCTEATITAILEPGRYWLWVGPSVFTEVLCGAAWTGRLDCGFGDCPGAISIARAYSMGNKFSFAPGEGPLVDARMPWPPDSYDPLLGIGVWNNIPDGSDDRIIVEMTNYALGLEDCFSLIETDSIPGHPNSITGVGYIGQGRYRIQLDRPITPDACTTIWYQGDGSSVRFISHPANINADSVAEAFEVLLLIDYLNGISDERAWGEYSSDIDHSATTDSFDVLRAIDLLSGESPFYAPGWANTELPECDD
jgi:hypothetical protein